MAPNHKPVFCNAVDENVGYKVKLCTSAADGLYCPICNQLMRKPVQTSRGELACESCYSQAIRGKNVCPIDGQSIGSDEIFHDQFKTNEILVLLCFCGNKEYGCLWEGTVGKVEEHQDKCEHVPVQCNFCQLKINQSNVVSHLDVCQTFSSARKCLYNACRFQPQNGEELTRHLESNIVVHGMLHKSMMSDMQSQLTYQIEQHDVQLKEHELKMQSQIDSLTEQFSLLMRNVKETQVRNEKTISNLQEKIVELENKQLSSINTNNLSANSNSPSQLEDVSSMVNVINQNVSDLNLRQQLFENTSYDGKLLWKIDNVSVRLNQAVIGKVTALHSAPTFNSRYGYKFCGRLYLNGDGVGKGTHVSMFFVLMKSEYDNLLQWPFSKRVTMRLVNQNQNDINNDITEHFNSNVNSSSFMKPKKDMNIASGCPLFITKEKFLNGGYIKDDTMFIELSVSL